MVLIPVAVPPMSSIPYVRQGAACGSRDRGRGGSPLPMCGRKPPRRCSRRGSRCNRGHRRDSRDDGRTPCPSRSTLTSRPRTKSSEIATCYSGVIVLPLILVPQDFRTLMRIESTLGSPRPHSELLYRQGTCRILRHNPFAHAFGYLGNIDALARTAEGVTLWVRMKTQVFFSRLISRPEECRNVSGNHGDSDA